ncbi:MAG: hypothetical protein QXH81_08085 [Thermofilaceae archaeon]
MKYKLYKINSLQEPEHVGTYDDPSALFLALLATLWESRAALVEIEKEKTAAQS